MRSSDAVTTLAELGTENDGLVTTSRAGAFGVAPLDLKRLTDHGLGEVIPHRHEFTSPRRRQTVHDDVRFHRATLTPSEHTASQGLAVTTVPRTLEDLAPVVDLDHFAAMVRAAFSVRDVGMVSLFAALDRCAPAFELPGHAELLQECFHLEGAPPELAAAQGLLRLVQPAGDAARRVHVT